MNVFFGPLAFTISGAFSSLKLEYMYSDRSFTLALVKLPQYPFYSMAYWAIGVATHFGKVTKMS